MIIIIPLGGIGKRFSDLGYKDPKPLIKVFGKEIIFWVLDNLKIRKEDKVYIVYNKELDKHNFVTFFSKYSFVSFLKLSKNTSGPVETIFELTKIIEKNYQNKGILIIDGDTFYKKNILKNINEKKHTIFYHNTKIKEPIFSYIKLKNNKIYKIIEKKKISNNANTGAYFFNNISKFNEYAKKILKVKKKAYVSDIYAKLIKNKEDIYGYKLKNNEFFCLGTPRQVIEFSKSNNPEKKRFCFDLDNTLVTFPKIANDYTTVEPIIKNIKFLNFLYSQGHHIIIHTARRMRTHNSNIIKVKKDIKKLTIKQLKKFKINYDELIFGKPYAHYYIDDLAINPLENLNIKLGYYESSDYESRKFNEIIVGEKYTVKNSTNYQILKNEIKYLKNIPYLLKKKFPKIIENNTYYYKMETIPGLKLSYLLINNLLTKDDISNIFKNIGEIHKFPIRKKTSNINIYENYLNISFYNLF